jgi:hypothetical protein
MHTRAKALSCISAAAIVGLIACGASRKPGFAAGEQPDGSAPAVQPDGGSSGTTIDPSSGDAGSLGSQGDAPPGEPCASGSTSISGTIYDPAARNPLYNVVAYVPSTTPSPLPTGASCDSCNALYTGSPLATALSDASGHFVLTGVPAGPSVPLVLQIGKWRKQMTVAVTACQDNPQPDRSLTLPKNQSEGDLPRIAVSTGEADTLECLLRRVGVDASEFVPGGSTAGHVAIFAGGDPSMPGAKGGPGSNTVPPGPVASQALWDSQADLMGYDIVLLSCEGAPTFQPDEDALAAYASSGGRVFASHFHYEWLQNGPWGQADLANWASSGDFSGNVSGAIVTTLPNGQVFPKGVAMQQWLTNVGALAGGELPIASAKHDVKNSNVPSQSWIVAGPATTYPGASQYFSFDAPLGAVAACGRVVFSDIHVSGASSDDPSQPVPEECSAAALSPQEDALEFMLFDLSSCVIPVSQPPAPPPPVPQ